MEQLDKFRYDLEGLDERLAGLNKQLEDRGDRLSREEEHYGVRLYRAIRWLKCAEQHAQTDADMTFIALWIALNACTVAEKLEGTTEQKYIAGFCEYMEKLRELDKQQRLKKSLVNNRACIEQLIESPYTFRRFWYQDNIVKGLSNWRPSFIAENEKARRALNMEIVADLLPIVMKRIYVLRNQLIHGGATHNSSYNRERVQNGIQLLMVLMPVFLDLMFDQPDGWGLIQYPPQGDINWITD